MDEIGTLEAIEAMDRIASAWRRRAGERLRPFGITLAQYELIRHLRRHGGLWLSVAAAELDWDRPTMSVVAAACLGSGWIKRHRLVHDRRTARIELTGQGEELLDRIEAVRPFAEASFGDPFDVIGSEERSMMMRLLDRVARRAGDIWAR
ncbi:MAG: MarR family winged helix-turn-helix transcriptional regulator [Treponema sp.]|nr:MarR family winged helix-turn-helix transcriptional regulator [Treponema sp.]